MGAGRLDVAAAVDPGLILDPPSLSFGPVFIGTAATISTTVRSMASVPETYAVTTLYTGDGSPVVAPGRRRATLRMLSASKISGFTLRPNGTLKCPDEFTEHCAAAEAATPDTLEWGRNLPRGAYHGGAAYVT